MAQRAEIVGLAPFVRASMLKCCSNPTMPSTRQLIPIEPLAPPKPALGQTCNGCGLCCLYQPCPLGMVLTGARRGACKAVRWNASLQRYQCGAVVASLEVLMNAAPCWMRPWVQPLAPLLRRFARRWIAAGTGCDSTIETYDA